MNVTRHIVLGVLAQHIAEAHACLEAPLPVLPALEDDAGLQAEIEFFDLVLAVEFAIRIVVYVISVVRYTETEHRTKAESPSVNMILGPTQPM